MKARSIAVKGRTVVLVSLLGAVGLLLPREADARHHKATRGGEARSRGKLRSTAPARDREANLACTAAFEKAKEVAQGSHFQEANEWFAVCAKATCGRSLRRRCAAVHQRIAALLPSVVPVVTNAEGAPSNDIVVRMDGEVLTSSLDGTAIVVDPGHHQFTFASGGEIFATRSLVIEKGQQHQVVSAVFQAPAKERADPAPTTPVAEEPAATPPPSKLQIARVVAEGEPAEEEAAPSLVRRAGPRRASLETDPRTGAPWSAYALAGVGLLGVGGYFTFNLKGSADNDALAAFCKPDCNPTSVRHVRNIYLAADISLGIGLAALAGSTYLFLRSDSPEKESARSSSSHITGLSVEPTSSGAFATVGGTF